MAEKKCIYVVDDEQVIAKRICLILQHAGYETSMFFDGESALNRIEETQPDLILSDVVLGGEITGIKLAEIVSESYPRVRVMLISGQANTSELLDSAHQRGFDVRVHAKPIAPWAMLQEIKLLLSTL